jgi:hypothetical protein
MNMSENRHTNDNGNILGDEVFMMTISLKSDEDMKSGRIHTAKRISNKRSSTLRKGDKY